MRLRNALLPATALAGLILFFCFLVRLLLLRYERGDIYPPYSTLRADPLGTRAYYEALETLDSQTVARNFTSLHRSLDGKPATLFFLGMDAEDLFYFSRDEISLLDDFVKNGGRVVISLYPRHPDEPYPEEGRKSIDKKKAELKKKDAENPPKNPPQPSLQENPDPNPGRLQTQQEQYEREELRREDEQEKSDSEKAKDLPAPKYHPSLAAVWGFGWKLQEKSRDKNAESTSSDMSVPKPETKPEVYAHRTGDCPFEASLPWKSALYFTRLEPEWQIFYNAKDKPVLIRRSWGKGEIIIASDSYMVSNEALRNDRRPALLAFLAGPPGRLLFDETHLGTQEQEGVVFLAKKFHLEGYAYGMLAVVLLFLWRNSAPLVPLRNMRQSSVLGGVVSGKDSRSGLVNLLRRHVPAADILKVSLTEWKRNVTPGRQHLHGKMAAMETTLSMAETARPGQIIESYHQLREINTPNRPKGNHATKS